MNVIVKRVGEPAGVIAIDGRRKHDELDKLVGGYSGRAFLYNPKHSAAAMAWCDDDGERKDLPINFARPQDGHPLLGTVVVTGWEGDGPNRGICGLTDDQVVEVLELLAAIAVERTPEASP